jgi:hypothetical protein
MVESASVEFGKDFESAVTCGGRSVTIGETLITRRALPPMVPADGARCRNALGTP